MKHAGLTMMLAGVLATGAVAEPARKGVTDIQLGLTADLTDWEDNKYPIFNAGIGVYATDSLQLGVQLTFEQRDWESYWGHGAIWGIGGYAEFDIATFGVVTPTLGASILFLNEGDSDTVTAGALSAGVKIRLTETLLLGTTLNYEWATEDIYDYERINDTIGSGEKTDISLKAGLHILFF